MCGPHRPVGQTGDRRQSWSPTGHRPSLLQQRTGWPRSIIVFDDLDPSVGRRETNGKGDRPGFYSGSGKEYE